MADDSRMAVAAVDRRGAYIEFVSEPGFDLVFESLEDIRSGVRLRNVRRVGDPQETIATLFVPNEKRGLFLRKLTEYELKQTTRGRPRNQDLVEGISGIRACLLGSFWNDDELLIPGFDASPIELWIGSDDDAAVERVDAILRQLDISRVQGAILFPERSVILCIANHSQLERLIELSDDIAELRLNKKSAAFYEQLDNREQTERARGLLARVVVDTRSNVSVCILDTGVNRGHMLLAPIMAEADLHAVDPSWGSADHDGHGTLMAGAVAYGDLLEALASRGPVRLTHAVESAKILPPPPAANQSHLWGFVTSQGIHRAEIQRPDRRRVMCLAVTSEDSRDRGRPSSWSAALDQMASGSLDNRQRLLVVSAGNVRDSSSWLNYPSDNRTNEIHDPGQSWNAITVGSSTEKTLITDESLAGYRALAPAGGLSPYSTTSMTWETRKWPIKPEVVCEGGNVAVGPNNSVVKADELQLLSTSHIPQTAQFGIFEATSASSARVAWIAAQIQSMYPEAWPESVRGLVIGSARWTEALKSQFLSNGKRAEYAYLVRVCGYGVPDLARALYCAANSLTLISQAELQPFDHRRKSYVTNEMHLYRLPWPTEVLQELGATAIEMRVTLSYFIEPSPAEIGWEHRYRYASHGLRFQMNGPGETEEEFLRRINREAREEGETADTEGPGDRWLIGKARDVGSIHSDLWRGTAADLSQSHLVAVFPIGGWWKERPHLGRWNRRCRYSLIVSIEPPALAREIDIYTPVAIKTGIAVPISIPVE
jgi:hypothetical protein